MHVRVASKLVVESNHFYIFVDDPFDVSPMLVGMARESDEEWIVVPDIRTNSS